MMQVQRISSALSCIRHRPAKKVGVDVLMPLVLMLNLLSPMVQGEPIDHVTYLSPFEKELVHEINLARQNPGKYAGFLEARKPYYIQTLFKPHRLISMKTAEGFGAVDEAIRFLRAVEPMSPLSPSRGMSLGARDHVKDQGPKGTTEHEGSDDSESWDRVNRYGTWQGFIGENIFYGQGTAREMVADLIIDDGVASRGHRENFFNAKFQVVGIACGDHATYRGVCVMVFADQYEEKVGKQ